jgi:hypothetical protein
MAPSRYDGITLTAARMSSKVTPGNYSSRATQAGGADDRTRDTVDRPLSGDVSIIHSSVIETAFRLEEKTDRGVVNAHSEVAEQTKNSDRR